MQTAHKPFSVALFKSLVIIAMLSVFFLFAAFIYAWHIPHFKFLGYVALLCLMTAIPFVVISDKDSSIVKILLLTPTLLVSFDTFFLRKGIANIYVVFDGSLFFDASRHAVEKAVWIVLLGNACLWLGFFWSRSKKTGEWLGRKISLMSAYEVRPRIGVILLIFLVGIGTRLCLVKAGVGGFFSDPSLRQTTLPYIQFLLLLDGLAEIGLVAYFCAFLKKEKSTHLFVFLLMLLAQVACIFFQGVKGQILYNFFYLAVTYVVIRKSSPWKLLLGGVIVVVLITPVNLAMRDAFVQKKLTAGNLGGMRTALLTSGRDLYAPETFSKTLAGSAETIVRNSAQLEPLAMVINYVDQHHIRFYGESYWFLTYWFIPRAIWPDKPMVNRGLWVRTEVYGRSPTSSAPQTVPGDFYINFGLWGVVIGFFLFGFLQRAMTTGLLQINNLRFLPLIPFVIFYLAQPQSDVGPHFVTAIKYTLCYALILVVMFPRIGKKS
jgi:hypothetical protein